MRNELGAKKQEFKRSEGEMKRILQEKNEQQETMQVEVAIMKQGISRKEAEWKNRLSANESLLGEAIHEKITLTEENRKFVDEVKLYTAKNSALLNENNQLRIALVDRYEAFRAAEIVRIEGQKKRNDAVMDLATVAESKGLIDFLNRKCDLLQKDLDDKHSELESQTLLHNDYVTKSEANCSLIKERVIALEEKERNLTTEIQQLCDNNLKLERNAEQMKEVHRISYQKYAETVEDLENQINDLRSQLEISQDAELKSKIAAEEALNRMVMKLSDLNTQARSITEVVDIENIKLKAENEMLQTQVNNLRNALESQMAKNECSEVSWKEMMQQFQLKLDTNAIKFKQSISKLEKANLELESQVKEAALRYSSADSSLKAQIIELRKRLESATENYEEAEALNEDLNLQLKSRSDGELAFKEQCLETQGKLEAQIKKLQEGEAVWMEQMMQFTAQLAAQSRAAQDAENASRLKFQEFKSKMNEKCKEYQDKLVAEKHENERLKKEITSANAQIQFLDVFKQELLQKEQYAKAENESLKTQIQELSQKIIYQNRDFETIESENRKENSRLESCIHDLQVTVVEMQEQSKKFEIIRADQDSESFRLKAATEAKLKELEALYSDQINDLVHKQEKAKNELTEEHKEILAFKEEKIRQLELQSAALRKEVTQHEINVQSMIADHAKELFEIQAKQSLELGALTAFAKTQEGLIENLKTTNASQIQSMKSNHQEEIENLHATYAAAANTIKISLNRQLSEMDGLTIAKKKEIESIRIEFDQAIQEHASQLQFLAESHNKEKEQISKKHELDLISLQANLATSHSREIQALRCEHEDLLNQVRSKDVAKIEESASIHERNVQEINELLKTTADDRAKFEENTHSLTLQLGEANTIIAQLREEIKSHHKKTSELNAVVEDTKKNFEIELESFKTSIHEKNCFIKALEAEKVLQSGLAKQFQSRLKEQYSTTLQAQLNAQIEAHQSQLEVLKIEFQKKNDALNGDLLSQLAISDAEVEKMRNLQSEYEFKIKILYEELQNSAALLQADVKEIGVKDALHKNETDKLKSAFEARLSDLKSDYDGLNETLTQTRSALSRSNLETLEIRNQYDAQILGMKNEFSETTRQYQAEIADSNRNLSELQTEVERLNAKYALDLVSIQEQIEAQAVKNKTQLGLMDQKITIQSEELEASLIKHNEAIIKMTLHHENEIEMSKARREALEIELDINQREMQKIKSNTLLEQLVAAQKFDSELVAQSGKYTKELKIKEAQFDTALQALKDDFAQSQSLQEHQSTQMANIYEESLKDREIKFRDLHKEYDAYKEDARKLEEELNLMLLAERRKAASLESNSKILSRRCDELNDELGTLKVKAEGLQSSLAAAEDLRTSQNAKLLAMQGKILFHTNLIQDLKLICFEFIENHDQQGSEELNFRDCFEKIFTDLNLKLRLAKNNLQELNITKDRERSEFTDTIEKLKLNLSQKSDEISTIYIELNRQKDLTRNLRAEIEDINENYVKLELSTKKLRTERTETIASFEESRALVSSLERKFQQKEGEISELNENSVGLKEKINSLKTQLANQLANSRSLEIKYLDLSNKLQDKESDCLVHLQKLVNHEETIKRMKEELESANANAAQAENEILKLDSLRSKETSVLVCPSN